MATDEELITRTVHDYFEGWYDADVAWMAGHCTGPGQTLAGRSRRGDLDKGAMSQACAGGEETGDAGRWLTTGIADVCGDIASAVVRSAPYQEYLHLIRTGDGWKIVDALWLPQ
jgi:Putative lumazine-binding